MSDCSTVSDTESTKGGTTSARSDSKSVRNGTKDTRKGTTNSKRGTTSTRSASMSSKRGTWVIMASTTGTMSAASTNNMILRRSKTGNATNNQYEYKV